ncbi:MAG: deoxyribose-phosphate aldolase [Ignavibacterium sp.]
MEVIEIKNTINNVINNLEFINFYFNKNFSEHENNLKSFLQENKNIFFDVDDTSLIIQDNYTLPTNELANKIDHTLLKPEAMNNEIELICKEADEFNFASVCVNPFYVSMCRKLLKNSKVKVCTVIGFPLGANTTFIKVEEAKKSIDDGANEIDMVINIGQLKSKKYENVLTDISSVVEIGKSNSVIVKVIIETCLLSDEEKIIATLITKKAKADFVKTSTGYSKGGATLLDVRLLKYVGSNSILVKASGGIRTRRDAELMIINGADRIGTSSGVMIVKNF